MPENNAAWLIKHKAGLEVKPSKYPTAKGNEIVVRNQAVAINPIDWVIQAAGKVAFRWVKPPFVLGVDLAGEVVEVGSAVTRFKVGDRVLGHAVGTDKDCNSSAEGSFQTYTVVLERMAAAIPSTMSYEDASVLPLGLSTAACGLFQKDQLGLEYPSAVPTPNGKTLLIWGGATSVGSNAIQLAIAAGYEVITTASPKNFDYVKKLGASQVFDYHSNTVTQDIIALFQGKTLAGAMAIGIGSAEPCADIVHACNGNKFISLASPPVSLGNGMTFPIMIKFVLLSLSLQVKCRTRHIKTKMIYGSSLKNNEVSKLIYEDFLPKALNEGRYAALPKPQVVGKGLEHIQSALDMQRQGVSATKIVVTL